MTDEQFEQLRQFAARHRLPFLRSPHDGVPVEVVPGLVEPELLEDERRIRLAPEDYDDVQRRIRHRALNRPASRNVDRF